MENAWKVCHTNSTNSNSYSPFELKDNYRTIEINHKTSSIKQVDGVLFLADTLKKEVLEGTKKQQLKKMKELTELFVQFGKIAMMTGIVSSLATVIMQPLTVSASTFMVTPTSNVNPVEITPEKIMEWALYIAKILQSIGIGLSMSMVAVAAMYMIITRKKKEGTEWLSNIVKGVIQVIVSVPLIWAIFQISQALFGSLPFIDVVFSK